MSKFNFNPKKLISTTALFSLATVQTLQPLVSLTANNQLEIVPVELNQSQQAQAVTSPKPNSNSKLQTTFNACYNQYWVNQRKSKSWNGKPSKDFIDDWGEFLQNTQDFCSFAKIGADNPRNNPVAGSELQALLLAKFDRDIAPRLLSLLKKDGWDANVAPEYVKVVRQGTALWGTASIATQKAIQAEINFKKADLKFSALSRILDLRKFDQRGNANGASIVDFYLTALQQDYQNRNNPPFTSLPSVGTGALLFLPSDDFPTPLRFNQSQATDNKIKNAVKAYRYGTIIPSLLEATAQTLLSMRAKGFRVEDSFNRVMAELGLDLLLGILDTPLPNTRRVLASIPESELRSAATRSSSPKKAGAIVDEIKGKKGGNGSSVADDAKPKRPSLECVAFNPDADKPEFSLAFAKSITKSKSLLAQTLLDSGVRVVSDGPMGAVDGLGSQDSEFNNAPEFSDNNGGGYSLQLASVAACTATQRQALNEIDSEINSVADSHTNITRSQLEHVVKGEISGSTQTRGFHHFETLEKLRGTGLIDVLDAQGKRISSINTIRRMVNNLEPIKIRYRNTGISVKKTLFPDNFTIRDIAEIGETINSNLSRKVNPDGQTAGGINYYKFNLNGENLKVGYYFKFGKVTTWFPVK